jgi:hypothetical protein
MNIHLTALARSRWHAYLPIVEHVAAVIAFAVIGLNLLHAEAADSGQPKIPRFEDYPANEEWQGPLAAVKLVTASERMFVTRLTEAAKQPPDFAGHYRFAGWGCGSVCAAGAIVDLKTGVVYPPPFGGKYTGVAHWILLRSIPAAIRGIPS